jgi:hypothetical protein
MSEKDAQPVTAISQTLAMVFGSTGGDTCQYYSNLRSPGDVSVVSPVCKPLIGVWSRRLMVPVESWEDPYGQNLQQKADLLPSP